MKIRLFIFVFALVIAFSVALFFQQEESAPTITSSPPLIDKPVASAPDEKVPKIDTVYNCNHYIPIYSSFSNPLLF